MTLSMTVDDIVAEKLAAQPAKYRTKLQFGGVRLDVLTNSVALRDKLRAYYRDFMGHDHDPILEITALETPPP